jgi:1,2-diacylglycerol 3-alpha-glucosyltransferase
LSIITLLVHWSSFGPYHIARLSAAFHELKPIGVKVAGMEIASRKDLFGWEPDNRPVNFERHVVFPEQLYEDISAIKMWVGVHTLLDRINPDVVAINGYSYYDAWSALVWCRLHRRPAILTSDSKREGLLRVEWKEYIKRLLIQQFSSALCAGTPQRNYLEQLGMKPEKVFYGLDVVDNDFFWRGAEQARKNPEIYRSLPGLETPTPFFMASGRLVKDKNLDGLLRAYSQYRYQVSQSPSQSKPWRLVILGDGNEKSALEHLVHSESIEGVTFAGFRQIRELPVYYGLASAFIHPTFRDTWGLVVNEAMASGLPVIVSNRAGCTKDLVIEGQNGFTFSPEDTVSLADLMELMCSENVDLNTMSVSSLDRIREWGLRRFTQGIYQALRTALK